MPHPKNKGWHKVCGQAWQAISMQPDSEDIMQDISMPIIQRRLLQKKVHSVRQMEESTGRSRGVHDPNFGLQNTSTKEFLNGHGQRGHTFQIVMNEGNQ